MDKVDITIIGAGVVGLAVARQLSAKHKNILVVEKYPGFGQETSSRNSEVIHAGLYYPKESLKTKTCIEGRRLLYEFCAEHSIPYRKTGKLVVATNIEEEEQLEELFRRALENGVQELRLLGRNEVKKIEPNIRVEAAILSGSTGIVDTHSLMKKMADIFQDNDGIIAYDTELIGIEKDSGGFELAVNDRREGAFKFFTRRLVNCAGLFADKISALSGLAKEEYRIKYCKGDYFRLSPAKSRLISHLVYPVPKSNAGLGVHATLDLAGSVRLGPDDEYVDRIYYDVDPSKADLFAQSASLFMPFVKPDDLSPDTSGIRPKLQGPNEGFRDFVIREESDNGFPGLVNLIGIESPGLTASLAIAGIVNTLF